MPLAATLYLPSGTTGGAEGVVYVDATTVENAMNVRCELAAHLRSLETTKYTRGYVLRLNATIQGNRINCDVVDECAMRLAAAYVKQLLMDARFRKLVSPLVNHGELILFALTENIARAMPDSTVIAEQVQHRDHSLGYGKNVAVVLDVYGRTLDTRVDVYATEGENGELVKSGLGGAAATSSFALDLFTPHWGASFSGLGGADPKLVRGRYFLQLVSPESMKNARLMAELYASHHIKTVCKPVIIEVP
jgi:hypothetical protein